MSRIFIDKFHHCWLLKCSKSWTKKKCSPKNTKLQESKKRNTYTVWLPFDFDIFYCFVLCLHSAVPVAFDWLLNNGFRKYYWLVQKYLWDRSKVEHKKNSPCCMPVWLVLMHVQRALVGSRCWNHNVFAPFFSLFEQKPTIIRFNGENVRKWTLIHCSRRSMWLFCCCCCFRCYVHRAFMYMSCSHLSCDDADYRSCSFFPLFVPSAIPYNTRCPIERMHSFIVILLDCLLSIQSLSLHCKSLVLRFFLLFFASFRCIRLLFCDFCFAFCTTFVVRARERGRKNKSA